MKKTMRDFARIAAGLALTLLMGCTTSRLASIEYSNWRPAPGTAFVVAVREGEAVSDLARRYHVSVEDIIAMNNLSYRDRVVAGERVYIPAYGRRDAAPPARTANATPSSRTASAPAPRSATTTASRVRSSERIAVSRLAPPTGETASAAVPAPRGRPATGTQVAARPRLPVPTVRPNAATAAGLAGRFIWPVSGRILSAFGRTDEGGRNDGINIAAARGTPVRAAADGTVTYVGNELKGYGNLLLIQHDDGFVTAYAHADRIAVQRGARVRSGEVVAYTGATGDVTEPQLHFEIRQNTRPVNPTAYIGGTDNQANRLPRDPARS
jgi:murein DD-endopeptidase MepM/ murein hydrolase activator NlpD